jgi:hypothetical protein
VTIIRRNWHLIPNEQLGQLLQWSQEQLQYTLREDDFLYIKLGVLKPKCAPLRYALPSADVSAAEEKIATWAATVSSGQLGTFEEPLFQFVQDLSQPLPVAHGAASENLFSPRFCYSYFAPYGDPLLEPELDPYPDGLLARLAAAGMNGVWLQGVLYTLAPFPWDAKVSEGYEQRLQNLNALVARAKKHGISIYLYLNEPRAMPLPFFERYPELKGAFDVREKNHASLCTSVPAVQDYIRDSVAHICKEVPDLGGFFSITFSENWTHCWAHSHETGVDASGCARCAARAPEEVIAEVNTVIQEGIVYAASNAELIVWDWVWPDEWIPGIIERLPDKVSVMSVSEWDKPIVRGGVASLSGEYALSVIGPGERAQRTWNLARARGLKPIAKVQAGSSWEISVVPYIPAIENVAKHAENMRDEGVAGLMMSWTLGGYPGSGLEVFAEMGRSRDVEVDEALTRVAERRFGSTLAPHAVTAWKKLSVAFQEFPFHRMLLYASPMQTGPSNPLWEQATGYGATMVGFPYDDIISWCGPFPPEIVSQQFRKVASGFNGIIAPLQRTVDESDASADARRELRREIDVTAVCAIQCDSAANQVEFVQLRNALGDGPIGAERAQVVKRLSELLRDEIRLAKELYEIQRRDSRIGFEASNQYMFVPLDLAEKVLNCNDLLERWIPTL